MARGSGEIQIEGLNALLRALRKSGNTELLAAIKEVNQEGAKTVEAAAKQKVPRSSGLLASSLRSTGTQRGGYVRAGRKRVPYAGVIHFGWPRRNIRPQPFLFDALDSRRSEVERLYKKRLADLCADFG